MPEQVAVPIELAQALAEHAGAAEIFASLPPSHRREYCQFVSEARRVETRTRRAAQAVAMLISSGDRT